MAKERVNPNKANEPFLDLLMAIIGDEKSGIDVAMEKEMDSVATEIEALLFFVKYHGKLRDYATRKLRIVNR